jgi:hypothetical protein
MVCRHTSSGTEITSLSRPSVPAERSAATLNRASGLSNSLAFQAEFQATPLTLYVEALGAVLQPVMDGRCAFGVMGSVPTALHSSHLSTCSAWDGPLSRLHRILWRHSRPRFEGVSLRNTGNSFSQTVPNCRKDVGVFSAKHLAGRRHQPGHGDVRSVPNRQATRPSRSLAD